MSVLLRVHEAVYKATGGLVGHRVLLGMPTLLLHTTGRRSGAERVTALADLADGDRFVVVAPRADRTPRRHGYTTCARSQRLLSRSCAAGSW